MQELLTKHSKQSHRSGGKCLRRTGADGLTGIWEIRSKKWFCAEARVAMVNIEGVLHKRGF